MLRVNHENPSGADANGALSLADAETRICLVCAAPAEELICATCKARIQGDALERKREEQRRAPG